MGSYRAWKLSAESDFASFEYFSEVLSARTWAVPDVAWMQLPGTGLLAFRLPGTTVERPACIWFMMYSASTKNLVFMGGIASHFKPNHHAVCQWLHPNEQEKKGEKPQSTSQQNVGSILQAPSLIWKEP